jgi:hypothetical protein
MNFELLRFPVIHISYHCYTKANLRNLLISGTCASRFITSSQVSPLNYHLPCFYDQFLTNKTL